MNTVTKLQPIFIIGAALLGLFLGYSTGFGNVSVHFVEPFLMVLLFFVFLSVDGKKLKEAFILCSISNSSKNEHLRFENEKKAVKQVYLCNEYVQCR